MAQMTGSVTTKTAPVLSGKNGTIVKPSTTTVSTAKSITRGGGTREIPLTPGVKVTPPQSVLTPARNALLNPQAQSAKQVLLSSNQQRQNVLDQSEALARDTNYAWNTKASLKENVVGAYKAAEQTVSQKVTTPFYSAFQKTTGKTVGQSLKESSALGVTSSLIGNQKFDQGVSGFYKSIAEDIRQRPLANVATFAAGGFVGAGVKGATLAVSTIPKVGGALATGFRITELGAGVTLGGLYAVGKTKEFRAAQTAEAKGAVIGLGLKETALVGLGYGAGQKAFDIGKGYFRTLGSSSLKQQPLQGEFPAAPKEKQLSMFQKNVFSEISDKPIAFHTTSQRFWQSGIVKPKEGTSELPGLYASTQISTPFSRISGSSSTAQGGFKNWIAALKQSIKEPVGKPAVLALEPKGFREAKFGFSPVKQFEGQKFVKGEGYGYFKTPTAKGYLDIPKMKTEIEAIARPKAGDYGIVADKKFYVTIKGERVPLDLAKYKEGTGVGKDILPRKGGQAGGKIKPEAYSIESIYSPKSVSTGLIGLRSYTSSKGSSKSSSIPSYSPSSIGPSSSSPYSTPSLKSSPGSSKPSKPSESFASSLALSSGVSFGPSSLIMPPSSTPSLGGFAIGVPKAFGSKSREARIAPSFSAIIGGTKATKAISVSRTLGVTPFTTRGLYTSKVGPKNYIKLTDL